jgi:16S rRNA (cytosine967-C5)-methyltransferase
MAQPDGLTARRVAFKALCSVIIDAQSLDECAPLFAKLPPQDYKFARALTLSTLRHFGPLEHQIRKNSSTGKKIKPRELNIIACMGMAQLKLLDVPDHAAVDATLKLAAKQGYVRQKGFLNAILRKTARESQKELIIDAKTSHLPAWMIDGWTHQYGPENIDLLIQSLSKEAPLDITCPDAEKRKELLSFYGDKLTEINATTLRFSNNHPNVPDIKGYEDGYWWVQDAASAYPISALIQHPDLKDQLKNLNILDVCAAPGGKTMQLASTGAHVTALDISAKRLERLQENLERTKLTKRVTAVQDDALNHQGTYDLIVLDAPCTATGTLRRHPDAAFTKTEKQMNELAQLQQKMLKHAFSLLAPNGYILYCTCSLQKNEGENVVKQFINSKASEATLTNLTKSKNAKEATQTAEKTYFFRSTPAIPPLHADGFFAALIQKK